MVLYSPLHFFMILWPTLLFIFLVNYLGKKRYFTTEGIMKVLGTITLISMIFESLMQVILNHDPILTKAPLDLCNFSVILVFIGLYYKNDKIMKIAFFTSLGALVALIIPDGSGTLDEGKITFVTFYLKHVFILLCTYYYLNKYYLNIIVNDIFKAFTVVLELAAFAFIYNSVTNKLFDYSNNFMYVSFTPANTPIESMGRWPYYIIVLIILVFITFTLNYVAYCLVTKRKILRN